MPLKDNDTELPFDEAVRRDVEYILAAYAIAIAGGCDLELTPAAVAKDSLLTMIAMHTDERGH